MNEEHKTFMTIDEFINLIEITSKDLVVVFAHPKLGYTVQEFTVPQKDTPITKETFLALLERELIYAHPLNSTNNLICRYLIK